MIRIKLLFAGLIASILILGCKSQEGMIIGKDGGAAVGAVIEEPSNNTALGAIIGATVGGAAGVVIGQKMNQQAAEMEEELEGATVERMGEGIVVEFSNEMLFTFDSTELSDSAKTNLTRLADILRNNPDTDVSIQGHTDNQGESGNNQDLSERRAIAVANNLAENGIEGLRLTLIGFGEQEPKYSNETENGRKQNRRVEFLITANEEMISVAERKGENNGS
ncbi:MAG: OmpA family protein [Balneolaceae bacterium]